jgi:hypothetical protein
LIVDTLCRYCGREVTWATSKAGKRYLAERRNIYNDDRSRVIKQILPVHVCSHLDGTEVTAEERRRIDERRQAENADALARGEIVVGQHVVIFKGRKYPIGTTGIVDWVAREADQYGVTKVRVVLNDGTKIYVNRENLRVAAVA